MSKSIHRRSLLLSGAVAATAPLLSTERASADVPWTVPSVDQTVAQFAGVKATYWGLAAPGVASRFSTATVTGRNAVALTFDACGGTRLRYDSALIAVLRRHQVPATLFINRRWAEANPSTFNSLCRDPLFEIANHGVRHIPLSVNGRSAYGIQGTSSVAEVWHEVAQNHWYLGRYGNILPRYFRPGTAYSDDVAARIVIFMGEKIVGFSINADAGATYPASTVDIETRRARAGDIILGHFNHPGSGTAAGMDRAIPALKARGLGFRRLREVVRERPSLSPGRLRD